MPSYLFWDQLVSIWPSQLSLTSYPCILKHTYWFANRCGIVLKFSQSLTKSCKALSVAHVRNIYMERKLKYWIFKVYFRIKERLRNISMRKRVARHMNVNWINWVTGRFHGSNWKSKFYHCDTQPGRAGQPIRYVSL